MFMTCKRVALIGLALVSGPALSVDWQALPTKAPEPSSNPVTPAKVELGKMLYHEVRISSNGSLSCNSCHNVMGAGDDNRAGSIGVKNQVGGRGAPTVYNSAFASVQFWDGRAASLEEQAKGPVTNPAEMGMKSWDEVVDRLKQMPEYVKAFTTAFGDNSVTADNAAKAIASYERTLITPNGPFDRYVKGDKTALTEQQVRGMTAFAETGCVSCHSGPAFNGPSLPEGTGFYQKFPMFENGMFEAKYRFTDDEGRFGVTKNQADKHLYKVPTLRNVALTAPYFHNGKVQTLDEAVRVMAKLQLNKDLEDGTVADLVAFLNSLTGEFPKIEMPRLPAYANKAFPAE